MWVLTMCAEQHFRQKRAKPEADEYVVQAGSTKVLAEGERGRSPQRTTILAKQASAQRSKEVWECRWRSRQASHLYILINREQGKILTVRGCGLASEDSYLR